MASIETSGARAFEAVLSGEADVAGKRVAIGKLYVPTGRIVACDPLGDRYEAFEKRVPKGTFPVSVLVPSSQGVPAFALIAFKKAKVARWEPASATKKGGVAGYPVDGGLGCFMDAATAEVLERATNKREKAKGFVSYYDDVLSSELDKHDGLWAMHVPERGRKHNVAVFVSGGGDGVYASFWGLDTRGAIVSLVTDFAVLGPIKKVAAASPKAAALFKQGQKLNAKYHHAKAVQALEAAQALDPENVDILRELCNACDAVLREEKSAANAARAIELWTSLIAREPQTDHYVRRAVVHELAGNLESAAEDADKGHEVDLMVKYWTKLGRYKNVKALAADIRKLEEMPVVGASRAIRANNNLGLSLYHLGDRARSAAAFKRAATLLEENRYYGLSDVDAQQATITRNLAVIDGRGSADELEVL